MSKFTPGPWKASHFLVVAPNERHNGPYGGAEVAHTGCVGNHNVATCEANAHLIAAAPDLLAACEVGEKCLRDLGGYPPEVAAAVCVIIGMMQDAIKKAKGQP